MTQVFISELCTVSILTEISSPLGVQDLNGSADGSKFKFSRSQEENVDERSRQNISKMRQIMHFASANPFRIPSNVL